MSRHADCKLGESSNRFDRLGLHRGSSAKKFLVQKIKQALRLAALNGSLIFSSLGSSYGWRPTTMALRSSLDLNLGL